jgi:tRNA nucleotidyltransferase/poly(A) polymerase
MSAVATGRLPAGGFLDMEPVRVVLALLDRDGERAMVVGGAVRNALLGLAPGDIDVATTALPDEVMRRAGAAGLRAVPTGIEHGTVTLLPGHVPIEVTTLREDVETDGRRATVAFGRDFSHDAERRDFTMNALYADAEGTVFDHVGGLADLEARRVRFIGDPETRIREDYLRILRLFRFHSAYGEGPLDREALSAAVRSRDGLGRLSAERVQAELFKLLVTRRAGETVAAVAEAGFLDRILATAPDTSAFAALAGTARTDPVLGLAAIALRSTEDAPRLSERLRLSNADARRLEKAGEMLPRLHERLRTLDRRSLRALAYRHGLQPLRDALAIEAARSGAWPLAGHLAQAAAVLDEPLPVLPWSGATVVDRGVAPGPTVGAVLARAEARWVDEGFPAEPARLAEIFEQAFAAEAAS